MKEENIKKFGILLEEEKEKIEEELKELEKTPVDFGGDVDSFEEESDEFEEIGNKLAVKETLESRLRKIEDAIEKTKQGKYGVCELCGEEIEEKVLETNPESEFCRECKMKNRE